MVSIEVDNQEIPVLFADLIENGHVMSHPAVEQHQDVPKMVLDPKVRFMVPAETHINDVEPEMTHSYLLSPLADRAAGIEQTIIHGPATVIYFK